jgi:hypothetical protein
MKYPIVQLLMDWIVVPYFIFGLLLALLLLLEWIL